MLDWALENGCGALATGHYASLRRDGDQVALHRGSDRNKDQSYFLAGLRQGQLSRLVFPLWGMSKPQVKRLAAEMGLCCAERRESQDVCFSVPGMSFPEALRARFADDGEPKSGFIVGPGGRRLGRHDGIHKFTIGQRRGVGVGTGAKAWVRLLDAANGDVYLTDRESDLACGEITVSGLSCTTPAPPALPLACEVQVRHRAAPVEAELSDAPCGKAKVALRSPVRAAAPGQAAVFFHGDRALGRGWIVAAGIGIGAVFPS
jgi:tRNA-specific 2-thiouridylase